VLDDAQLQVGRALGAALGLGAKHVGVRGDLGGVGGLEQGPADDLCGWGGRVVWGEV
jgi:hypothetical protein